jgi:hypothetical protein
MRSKPTCTVRDIGEVVNALPSMFGFPPQDSLVALGLRGKRVCFGMRVDLDEVEDRDVAAEYVVGHLQHQRADGAIVIAVGQPLDVGRELVLAIESRLHAARRNDGRRLNVQPVAGGWATDDRFWVSMAGGDPDGYPYRRSLDHPVSLQAIAEGQEIVASRAELEAKLEPFGGIRRRWLDASAGSIAERCDAATDDELSKEVERVVHDLLAGRPVADGPILRVAYAITRIPVRDSAWGLITPDNARDMVRVWMHVARIASPDWAPPALSLVAFTAWLRGDGAFAVTAAQRALQLAPGYSMARLMMTTATSGFSPDQWPGWPSSVE